MPMKLRPCRRSHIGIDYLCLTRALPMCLTSRPVDLLERDAALRALAEAHSSAARGEGRMVSISGEPGIGKTSLVRRFAADVADGRVLFGTCDDLSIPRPLGPFRDLAGSVSAELEDAL